MERRLGVHIRLGPRTTVILIFVGFFLLMRLLTPYMMQRAKPIPGLAGQPNMGQAFLNSYDPRKWNEAIKALGGIAFSPAAAQSQIDQFRDQTGQTAPLLPPAEPAPAPQTEPGQQPPQVTQDMVVKSYPPETYESSQKFIDARMTGFEKLHEGFAFDEGLGNQCVAGAKYWILSGLGINIHRSDGGLMLFAPNQPNPGYPGPAYEDFKAKWNWVNNPVGPEPADSILPPKGIANIDGTKVEYHTELINDVNALQRGDIVIFPIHVGMFSAYTQDGQLLLFDQNGTASMDPFTHHAFAKSNFVGAIRVVYHINQ